jgi:hypothetical protein
MDPKPEPRVRTLYAWEIAEASKVYGSSLNYSRVRIHENDPRPDSLDQASRKLRRMKSLPLGGHNAMTIGNHCFFPIELPVALPEPGFARASTVGWLMHELGHVWQFQRWGWAYLFRAIWVQMTKKAAAYELPDLAGLKQMRAGGITFFDFSVEQQGDLFRNCYLTLSDQGEESEAYQVYSTYVKDIHA